MLSELVVLGMLVGVILQAKKDIKSRWHSVNGNQQLIVLRNGEPHQICAGTQQLAGQLDTVVQQDMTCRTFSFKAEQVTNEMQGLRITGQGIYSIFREGDGPSRFQKNASGANIDESIKLLVESVIRSIVANTDMETLLRKRTSIKDNIIKQVQDKASGWGVWMETIELTEMNIMSSSLFTDMQQKQRSTKHVIAEQQRLDVDNKVEDMRLVHDERLKTLREDSNTRKKQVELNNEIKVSEKAAEILEKETQIDKEKLAVNQEIKELETGQKATETMKESEGSQIIKDVNAKQEIEKDRKWAALDEKYDERSLDYWMTTECATIIQNKAPNVDMNTNTGNVSTDVALNKLAGVLFAKNN